MTKFEKIIHILGQVSLIGFIVTFPFNFQICKFFQEGIGVFVLINPTIWKNFKLNNLKKEEKTLFLIASAYLLWEIISLFWSDNLNYGFKTVIGSLPILFFPLALTMMRLGGVIKEPSIYLKIFSISTLAVTIVCLCMSYFESFYLIDGVEQFRIQKEGYFDRPIFEAISSGYSKFSYTDLSHFTYPRCLAECLCVTILVTYNWIYENNVTVKKILIGAGIILYSSVFIYILQSRTNFIVFALIIATILANELFIKKHKLVAIPIACFALFGLFGIVKSERIQDAITKFQKGETEGNISESNSRLNIWQSAVNVIKKYPILGTGIGDCKDAMLGEYLIEGKKDFYENGFACHNQFLQSQLSKGIIGLFTTAIFILIPLIYGIKNKDYMLVGFFAVIFINDLFDNELFCYWNLAFITMIMWFLLQKNQEKTASEITEGSIWRHL